MTDKEIHIDRYRLWDKQGKKYFFDIFFGNHHDKQETKHIDHINNKNATGADFFENEINKIEKTYQKDYVVVIDYNGVTKSASKIGQTRIILREMSDDERSLKPVLDAKTIIREAENNNLYGGLEGFISAKLEEQRKDFQIDTLNAELKIKNTEIEKLNLEIDSLDKENEALFNDNEILRKEIELLKKKLQFGSLGGEIVSSFAAKLATSKKGQDMLSGLMGLVSPSSVQDEDLNEVYTQQMQQRPEEQQLYDDALFDKNEDGNNVEIEKRDEDV